MLQIEDQDARMTVSITWPKVFALVLPLVLTIAGGYWLLIDRVVSGISTSISELRADTSLRFQGREVEDRDIRELVRISNDQLRDEISELGDRIVASNADIGDKIDSLRNSMIGSMEQRDDRFDARFDRIEEKLDELIREISLNK